MVTNDIDSLVYLLAKMPGLGPRSARRAVLHMLKYKDTYMIQLANLIKLTSENVTNCKKCGNVDTLNPCKICINTKRDQTILCVVETVADLWAIERGDIFNGLYHVIGGTLSMHNELYPDNLALEELLEKVRSQDIKEIIIATNATIEGQTTAYYITELLKDCNIKISKLAHGIPMGGELDYLDEATLQAALQARQPF